jgi:hypothetical protein
MLKDYRSAWYMREEQLNNVVTALQRTLEVLL